MNQTPRWVDTHCHLEMLKEPAAGALEKGAALGLDRCLTIGTNHRTNLEVVAFCDQFEGVYGAVGFHPHHAKELTPGDLEFMDRALGQNPKLVAVGECGLDFYYGFSEPQLQTQAFGAQLQLAHKHQKPVVIHSREAETATLECLRQHPPVRGVFHSFTSSSQMAAQVLELGFYLGFNGICTFPKSDAVREVLRQTPKNRLLLETDAPYLSPVPLRGKPNLPGNVSLVGAFVAEFLGLKTQELAEICYQNTLDLFGLPK